MTTATQPVTTTTDPAVLAYYLTKISPQEASTLRLRAAEALVRAEMRHAAVAADRAASGFAEGDLLVVKRGWDQGRTAKITGVNTQTGAWLVQLDSGMPGAFFSAELERAAGAVLAERRAAVAVVQS